MDKIEKTGNDEATTKVLSGSKDEILNALKNKFSTSVNRIYINSIGEEVGFREITVAEQKTLSRILIDNENRRDISYDAQCAMINKICLNDGFNIYSLSEFDKLKLQIAMYQSNVVKNDVNFVCEECGTENVYKLDFGSVMDKLDKVELKPLKFSYSNKFGEYRFEIEYPSVKKVSDFYRNATRKYRPTKKNDESVSQQIGLDYIILFIKSMEYKPVGDTDWTHINLWSLNPGEGSEILEAFPQDVIYNDSGVLAFITENTINVINDAFEKHKCLNCGHYQSNANVEGIGGFLA